MAQPPADKSKTTIQPGQILTLARDYTILSHIGEGGMGQVVLVTSPFINSDMEAAMKILDKSDMASYDALERFHREAELLSKASHPNIARFIEYFESDSFAYLVMEYVDGFDLEDFMDQNGGTLEPGVIIDVVLDIFESLVFMYEEHGMCHRDLKPANILVRKNNAHIKGQSDYRGVLIDFGNTKITEDQDAESLTMMSGLMSGTPGFTAPTVTLDVFDEKDDVFSMAATVMSALLGHNPFEVPNDIQASRMKIMAGELDLGEYEDTAIGCWIRINVSPNQHDRFTLRQAMNVLHRIRDNPLKPSTENFVRTIASDDAMIQLTEKVDALQGAEDMNTMAEGLLDLGFNKSWLEEALDSPTPEPSSVHDDVEPVKPQATEAAPEYALIDSLLKKKQEEKEVKEVEEAPRGKGKGILLALIFIVLLQAAAIAFLFLNK